MGFFSALRVALSALLVNKGRSALTSLGIVIGIGAVIAMVSAGGGARRKLDERLESVGKNLILIRPGARTASGTVADTAPLKQEDVEAIRKYTDAGEHVSDREWLVNALKRAGLSEDKDRLSTRSLASLQVQQSSSLRTRSG